MNTEIINPISDAEKSLILKNSIAGATKFMLGMEQAACPVEHFFSPGVCIRQVTFPAGVWAIGHTQANEHMNIVLKGKILLVDDVTKELTEIVGPTTFVGKPGQKLGYIEEETIWQNVYATTETDINKIEEMVLRKSPEFLEYEKQLMAKDVTADREDYERILLENGFDEEIVQLQVQNTDDYLDLHNVSEGWKLSDSPIHGKGVFAMKDYQYGDVIGACRIMDKRLPLGRWVNHSANPNAFVVSPNGEDIFLVAARNIHGMQGGMHGDEITTDYSYTMELNKRLARGELK